MARAARVAAKAQKVTNLIAKVEQSMMISEQLPFPRALLLSGGRDIPRSSPCDVAAAATQLTRDASSVGGPPVARRRPACVWSARCSAE